MVRPVFFTRSPLPSSRIEENQSPPPLVRVSGVWRDREATRSSGTRWTCSSSRPGTPRGRPDGGAREESEESGVSKWTGREGQLTTKRLEKRKTFQQIPQPHLRIDSFLSVLSFRPTGPLRCWADPTGPGVADHVDLGLRRGLLLRPAAHRPRLPPGAHRAAGADRAGRRLERSGWSGGVELSGSGRAVRVREDQLREGRRSMKKTMSVVQRPTSTCLVNAVFKFEQPPHGFRVSGSEGIQGSKRYVGFPYLRQEVPRFLASASTFSGSIGRVPPGDVVFIP